MSWSFAAQLVARAPGLGGSWSNLRGKAAPARQSTTTQPRRPERGRVILLDGEKVAVIRIVVEARYHRPIVLNPSSWCKNGNLGLTIPQGCVSICPARGIASIPAGVGGRR